MHLTYTENWWPVKYCIDSTRELGCETKTFEMNVSQ